MLRTVSFVLLFSITIICVPISKISMGFLWEHHMVAYLEVQATLSG